MRGKPSNTTITLSLLFAVVLWGGNNTGTKVIVNAWPPIWTGASRFLCAGLILLGLSRWTTWLGAAQTTDATLRRRLWLRGGLSLATYIVSFNWALRFTTVSHIALYLGAAPVWALLWEGRPAAHWTSVRRYGAAMLALTGVLVLFWPALQQARTSWPGEVLGLTASVLWTNYGRQCRALSGGLSGALVSAHTMCGAGVLLMPLALVEIWQHGLTWPANVVAVQAYCILAGGVAAFAIWNNALRYWPTSQVFLFNNLIPLSSMTWARVWLGEPVTATFWVAMLLILAGVILAQWPVGRWLGRPRPVLR